MNCYLCNSTSFKTRKGIVRDAKDLKILECVACGLVTLSSIGHIQKGFYEKSGMHGEALVPIDTCFLNSPILAESYANTLAAIGKCDTLIAHLELES